MDLKEFLENGDQYFLPNLSIDVVIIGYYEGHLKCLLLRIADRWFLPGGYIGHQEAVDEAAVRILRERTGLEAPHLKFLSVFGEKDRHFEKEWQQFAGKLGYNWQEDLWFNKRFVSLAYYSLVHIESTAPKVGYMDEEFGWFDFSELPEMALDHATILDVARNRLKEDIVKEPLTYKLLPDQFTMPELHQLHQTILGEQIDRSRFQKKMLASGIFERLPKLYKDTPGRNPFLYRVKD